MDPGSNILYESAVLRQRRLFTINDLAERAVSVAINRPVNLAGVCEYEDSSRSILSAARGNAGRLVYKPWPFVYNSSRGTLKTE